MDKAGGNDQGELRLALSLPYGALPNGIIYMNFIDFNFKDNTMNKEVQIKFGVDQLIEQGNLEVIKTIFSTDYIAHAGDKDYKGHEFIKKYTKQIRSAIPDIKIISVEFLVKTNNTITWLRTLSGTHKENMRGIPPSGKKVKWQDMVVSRFQEGKIAEEWVVSELAGELTLKSPINK